MPVQFGLHMYSLLQAVKVFNMREQAVSKPQINAAVGLIVAFVCVIDYQRFALTNSYGFNF